MLKTGKADNIVKTVLENDAMFSLAKALFAVVLAFFFGFVILLITGSNPVEAYRALFQGAFGSRRGFGETLLSTTARLFSVGLDLRWPIGVSCLTSDLKDRSQLEGLSQRFLGIQSKGSRSFFIFRSVCLEQRSAGRFGDLVRGF